MERKLPPPFVFGESYLDHDGEYTVVVVKGSQIVLERENGTRSTADAAVKARIHRNVLSERGNGHSLHNVRVSFSGNHPIGFAQKDVFPIIAAAIERLSNSSQGFVTHADLVYALLDDDELRPLLDQLAERDPQCKTMFWWASTMVAWFSQAITVGRSEWEFRFERKRIEGCGAYRVARNNGKDAFGRPAKN